MTFFGPFLGAGPRQSQIRPQTALPYCCYQYIRISAGDFIGSALSAMRHTQLSTHHGRGDESPPSTVLSEAWIAFLEFVVIVLGRVASFIAGHKGSHGG